MKARVKVRLPYANMVPTDANEAEFFNYSDVLMDKKEVMDLMRVGYIEIDSNSKTKYRFRSEMEKG